MAAAVGSGGLTPRRYIWSASPHAPPLLPGYRPEFACVGTYLHILGNDTLALIEIARRILVSRAPLITGSGHSGHSGHSGRIGRSAHSGHSAYSGYRFVASACACERVCTRRFINRSEPVTSASRRAPDMGA